MLKMRRLRDMLGDERGLGCLGLGCTCDIPSLIGACTNLFAVTCDIPSIISLIPECGSCAADIASCIPVDRPYNSSYRLFWCSRRSR